MSKKGDIKKLLVLADIASQNKDSVEFIEKKDISDSLINLAKSSGLFYHILPTLNTLDSNISTNLIEKKHISKFKNTINILNKASKSSGIRYILIKDVNTITHVPRDVDIFVRQKDREKFLRALSRHGLKCEHADGIETTFISKFSLPIDIYTKIIYFGHEFIDEDLLFNSRIEKKMFNVSFPGLDKETDFLLTILHSIFGHRSLSILDFLHLKNLKEDLSTDLCENYAESMNWRNVFIMALEELISIEKKIDDDEEIDFPYIFSFNFMMEAVKSVLGEDLTKKKKLFIIFSLLIDGMKIKVENSVFYGILRKSDKIRKFLLLIGYKSRSIRGDRYS